MPSKKQILGGRAYISKTMQMDLFEQYQVRLKVAFRNINMTIKNTPKSINLRDK
jgi:hypothetical protein